MARIGRRRVSWLTGLGVLLCLVSFSSLSLAENHANERFTCDDLERAERLHRDFPDNVNYEINYAICQVLIGDREEGLSRLYHVTDQQNNVFAAYFLAEYIEYGGDFELPIDGDKVDEAIDAYFRVLFLIDLTPYYPRGYELYEYEGQMELQSHYRVPWLYMQRFAAGAFGLYREHLLNSPGYEGDRDLKTYPKYSRHTLDSLEKVIEHGNRCIALPKKRYFRQPHYDDHQKACRILKDTAEALLPLEEKRLNVLATKSCSDDVLECQEHKKLLEGQITPLFVQAQEELDEIFALHLQRVLPDK
ncbi:MAG: hypothetical protein OXE57_08640 [Alphaproteobacteria bacterium]|nr:hypothetical protein [Alphaproteobacteria bacterium]